MMRLGARPAPEDGPVRDGRHPRLLSLAVYGKGGSGKSTIAAALSSCFAAAGHRVLHFGCDPKSDSSRLLVGEGPITTVIGSAAGNRGSFLMSGTRGITCLESGGPEPGVGCAGRGITRAFEVIEARGVRLGDFDVVVYDVLGDVVCGGFAAPLRSGHARHVLVVASGTGMSLFAANNIMKAVRRFGRNGVFLAGLVGNYHMGETFRSRLAAFARATGTELLAELTHDPDIQRAEERLTTVYDFAGQGRSARIIGELGRRLLALGEPPPPEPLTPDAFDSFVREHAQVG